MALRHNSTALTIVRVTLCEIVAKKILDDRGKEFRAEVIEELSRVILDEVEEIRALKNPAHLGILDAFPDALKEVIEEIS